MLVPTLVPCDHWFYHPELRPHLTKALRWLSSSSPALSLPRPGAADEGVGGKMHALHSSLLSRKRELVTHAAPTSPTSSLPTENDDKGLASLLILERSESSLGGCGGTGTSVSWQRVWRNV